MKRTRLPILLVEVPTNQLLFTGTNPYTREELSDVNLGHVVSNTTKITQPLLAAFLKRDLPALGYDPEFAFFDGKTMPINMLDVNFETLQSSRYIRHDLSTEYAGGKVELFRRGVGLGSITNMLCNFPVAAFTANFTFEAHRILEAVHIYKSANPKGKVAIGGRDAMFRPEYYLLNGADAVVIGEGDEIAAKLLVALVEGREICFSGVAFQDFDGSFMGIGQRPLRAPIRDLPLPYFFSGDEILRRDLPGGIVQYYVQSQDGPLPSGILSPLYHCFFSRGCIYDCSFCPNCQMGRHDCMPLEQIEQHLRHLKNNGVKTLIFAEDAFLERVLSRRKEGGREEIIQIMQMIRDFGFSVEWANGINIHVLVNKNKEIDLELLDAVFSVTYRLSVPVERAAGDERLRKLTKPSIQRELVAAIASRHHPFVMGLMCILRPEDSPIDYLAMQENILEMRVVINEASNGLTKSRVGLFSLISIPGSADESLEPNAAFPIDTHPFYRHFFTPSLNGRMSYAEQFWARQDLLRAVDPDTYHSWLQSGIYCV